MIDLHTHTLFSDGVLLPTELVRRALVKGYTAIAITDHADISNLDFIIPRIIEACNVINSKWNIKAIPGVELTHVPPDTIADLTDEARQLGARLVLVHGETIVEPVIPGTNRAAIEAGVDILAHPGLIDKKDIQLAKKKGIYLEITTRSGHSYTNGYVASEAMKIGAKLIINTDTHQPHDLVSDDTAERILLGAGVPQRMIKDIFINSKNIIKKI
jgi:histidinol phosphatase-like PHP family hydrolase